MNKNLYSKELKRNAKSWAVWTAIVIAFTLLVMSLFPYMKNMGDQMAAMMSSLPQGMTRAMGINEKTFNSILGMYNTYYGIYIVVLLAIFTSSTAATIISKEERYKTAEFLLTKPISRNKIFNTKLAVLFTLAFGAYILQTLIAFILVIIIGESNVNWSIFTTMHVHGLVLIVFFTSLGLFLSMILKPKANFMGLIVGIVFGSYFLGAISKVANVLHWIGYITPFYYLDFNVAQLDYGINYLAVLITLAISVVLLFASLKIYQRKDIGA